MTRGGLAALTCVSCLAVSACAGGFSVGGLDRPGQDVVVLLPDSANGTVGRATVSNASGATELTEARAATRVLSSQAPSAAVVLSESDVEGLFGAALASLPPAAKTFTLYFQFASEDLTAESRAFLAETLEAVKLRPVPDVLVVGHTDTTGAPAANFELALRRANTVRALLVAAGLDERAVAVVSHGEAQPLVRTPDGTYEPRNRRVEITVR